jgi:hypothetical protein
VKRLWVLLALLAGALAIGKAEAVCTCLCMNGEARAVCTTTTEPEPVCPPRFCPMPLVVPEAPQPPSAGPRNCVIKEILNDRTGKFEKREVCS